MRQLFPNLLYFISSKTNTNREKEQRLSLLILNFHMVVPCYWNSLGGMHWIFTMIKNNVFWCSLNTQKLNIISKGTKSHIIFSHGLLHPQNVSGQIQFKGPLLISLLFSDFSFFSSMFSTGKGEEEYTVFFSEMSPFSNSLCQFLHWLYYRIRSKRYLTIFKTGLFLKVCYRFWFLIS